MKRFLPSLFLVSLMALQLLAMPKKEMLALDFTAPNAYSICATDITKLQGADFPDRVKALKVGDELLMKTAEAVYTGRVTLAYRDVNMTEVRAGYFNHHNLKNNEIWHVTFDKDYMVGWLENTYLAKDYSFLYNMNTEVISSLNLTQEDFSCGNDQEVSNLKLSEEQAAEAQTFSSGVRAGEPYYTNYWQNPEYVTQTYLVCFTKEAYQDQLAKGGINNMIAHGVAHGTLLLSNSNVRACLKLVHTEMVPYENHGDSSRSLGDFAGYRNGMEGTYDMRSRYGADMCSIGIKRASSTGLAYVSGGVTGSESSSFSCMDSGFMAATGWIHESGHTMGGRHYIDTYSPGSSSLFNHSFGCHNTPPGAQREQGSVMARSSGLFNYFSSTNIYYDGVPISTNVKCRVADTWQKVRLYASRYRSLPTLPELSDAISCENFEYQDDAELMFQDGGVGFASPWYHCNTNVFRIVNDGSESYLRVYNTNVFSCLASRFLHWGRGINPSYEYFLSNIWLRASLRVGAKSSCTLDLNAPTFNFSQGKVRINNLSTTSKDVPLGEKFDFVVLLDTQSDAQHRNATFYAWINPPTDSEPSKESADIVLTRSTSTAFRNLRQLRLTAAANTEDSFDLYSFNLGFSFASLFPPVHPKKFSVVPGNYTNETIRLVWEKQGTPNAYKIFRGLSNNFACATEIGTAAAEAETFEDKTPNQGVRYFYWLQTLYTNYTFTSLSRRGVAGIPIVSACANGPYVIGQGQIARFKADGSLGFNPMIRWTVDGYPSPYLTNHYYFSYNEHQTMIPGVYPVSIFVSEQEVDTPVYTDETTLTVTNSYPSVVITCLSEHIMEGNNLLFLATPSDPGTNDTLTVRWNFGDGSAWSDFTNGYYAVHNFATQGVYNISCEVKDNYGAVTCQTLSLDVSAGSGLPVVPTELVLENGHSGILKLGNLGSKAYNFSASSTSAFLKINPASGTVAGGVSAFTPLLLTFDHAKAKGIGGTFFLNLTANGETQTISVTVPTTPVQIAIQEPKTILRDWVSDFSALGTQSGYKTRWLLDGEQLAPDSDARVLRTVPNLSAGGHTLALLALDEENQICAAVTNELTVIERAPDVFLEEKARDDSTVTYNPVVLGAGTGFTEIRYDWGDGNGWTTWLPVEEISHDFLANKKYFVRCQISCAGVVNETSLLYNPELALTVNTTFADLNTNYLECAVGERVNIKLQAEEGTKTFWRENFSNPALGLLEDETAAENSFVPSLPGEYAFIAYAATEDAIGAPSVLVLQVLEAPPQAGSFTVAGLVYTNTVFGSGTTDNCYLRVVGENFDYGVTNAADGSFVIEGLPRGEAHLTLSSPLYAGRVYEINLTNDVLLSLEAEIMPNKGFVYAEVTDDRSYLPIAQGKVNVGFYSSSLNDRGRTTALTLPFGEYLMTLKVAGRPQEGMICESLNKPATYAFASHGYSPFVHGFLYGTGDEIVTEGTIQVLSEVTKNIVLRYQMNEKPYYSLGLQERHKTTLRYRLSDYDNENYTINSPLISFCHDVVLTPEPGFFALILLLITVFRKRLYL